MSSFQPPSCSSSADCLTKLPSDCASRLAQCAQSKCQSASGGLGQRLSNLLANPSATGAKDLTAHQVAGAIRDTLDLAGACVQRQCPEVASTCLATLCSRGSCVRSASVGTQCTQHSDCTASVRGPSAPGTPTDPLPDPAAVIKPASSDPGLFTASTSSAWGGVADSPFARTGIAIPRLAYCHKPSRTCRLTLPLDSVLGSSLSIAYPIRSSNDTRFAFDAPLVPAARIRLTAHRCTETPHCPLGVCSSFLHQCTLDRPLHIHAALLASPSGGSGAGEGIGPLIAMIAGGICGAILIGAAGFFVYRARNPPPKPTVEELAREEAEFVASVHRMSMASGFPASLMSGGGNRTSYYAPTDASGKPVAVRPSVDSSRSGGDASSATATAGAGDDEEEFWKFERPDFDKPVGFRRNRTAVNANGGGARHSAGSLGTAPSSATRLSSPTAHRLSANRMSGATAVARPVSSASGILQQNRHSGVRADSRNSWLAAGGNARRPSAGPTSPRTPTKLAPVFESDDDVTFVPGSPASLPLGSPRARPALDDRPTSMVVGSRPAPTASGMRVASYLSSRRGSALDKPLPTAPTPVMTPTTPSAAAPGSMSPLLAMETSVPASTAAQGSLTSRSLANPTPEFAATATAATPKDGVPVPVFNLIMPTLERSSAEAATLTRQTDVAPPVPTVSSIAEHIDQQQPQMAAPPSPKVPPKDPPLPASPLMRASPAPAPAPNPAVIVQEPPGPMPHMAPAPNPTATPRSTPQLAPRTMQSPHPAAPAASSPRASPAPSPFVSPRSTPQLASRAVPSAHPAVSIPTRLSSATLSPAPSPSLQPVSIGDALAAPPRRGSSSVHPPTHARSRRPSAQPEPEPEPKSKPEQKPPQLPHEQVRAPTPPAAEGDTAPMSMDTLDRALSQLANAVDDWVVPKE